MKIADLFVDLDIKGATKVKDALVGTQEGLQKTAQMSLAAKAGIFAAILGLEELTRSAVGTAVDMKNFAGATGLSTIELQKWQYLAKMNDVAGEELTGTIKGLQNAQAAMALGKGVPEGALWFGLDPKKNPLEMFGQIQAKLREVGNDQRKIGIARSMAATLGISDNMFAMLRVGNLSLAGFRKEMLLTMKEQQKLLELDRTWNKFWYDLKVTSEKAVAEDLAKPITGAVHLMSDSVHGAQDVIHALNKLFGEMHLDTSKMPKSFEAMGLAIAGFVAIVNPWIGALVALAAAMADIHRYTHGEDSIIGGIENSIRSLPTDKELWAKVKGMGSTFAAPFSGQVPAAAGPGAVGPPSPIEAYQQMAVAGQAAAQAPAQTTQNNTIEVNLHGYRDRDVPPATANAVVRAMNTLPGVP